MAFQKGYAEKTSAKMHMPPLKATKATPRAVFFLREENRRIDKRGGIAIKIPIRESMSAIRSKWDTQKIQRMSRAGTLGRVGEKNGLT